jgi:NAD(P)-dependent dehydrogenase (short-subunit alcohol dehydrogenase family)
MRDDGGMTNTAILVTGASTGIGRATALRLDSLGFTVFAGVRKAADGAALEAAASDRLIPLIIDVTKAATIATAAAVITTSGIPLVGLVNNAGIAAAAPMEFVPIEELRNQLEVNVVGQIAVIQAVMPLLREAQGRIVNITSIGGLIAGPMLGPYHASKYALEALTDTLRIELAPWGMHVAAIEPGQIATPIWSTASDRADRMIESMPSEAMELYGAGIRGARKSAKNAQEHGASPDLVAKAIEHALTAKRPKTRYLVGSDAKAIARVVRHLPDRTRDRLMVRRRS